MSIAIAGSGHISSERLSNFGRSGNIIKVSPEVMRLREKDRRILINSGIVEASPTLSYSDAANMPISRWYAMGRATIF